MKYLGAQGFADEECGNIAEDHSAVEVEYEQDASLCAGKYGERASCKYTQCILG